MEKTISGVKIDCLSGNLHRRIRLSRGRRGPVGIRNPHGGHSRTEIRQEVALRAA